MPFSFKNILIPVDLTVNSEVAIKKAMELADKNACIHLLHVISYDFASLKEPRKKHLALENESNGQRLIEKYLNSLKVKIEESGNNIIVHNRIVVQVSIQKAIEIIARQDDMDLIIIGKNSHHSWLPFLNTVNPGQIVQRTGVSVFTVKPGSVYDKKVKTMVVPISPESVEKKMEIMAAICAKLRVKIFLVAFVNKETDPAGHVISTMLEVYQWLRAIHCPVECSLLYGYNKARAILNYSENVNADILLLQPNTETKIGWPNKHISDVLPIASKVQVWNV